MGLLITGKTVTDDGWYGKANRHGAKAPRRAWLVNRQAAKDAKGDVHVWRTGKPAPGVRRPRRLFSIHAPQRER
jgi:hypothetical protein